MRKVEFGLMLFLGLWGGMVAACETDDRRGGAGDTGEDTGSVGSTSTDSDSGTQTDPGSSDPIETGSDPGSSDSTHTGEGCSSMDILFVIDNSESMKEEQESLIASFPGFIDVLRNYKNPSGHNVDFRVGVTTTGVTRNFKETTGGMQSPSNTYSIWCESTMENCVQDGVLQGQQDCGLALPWMESTSDSLEAEFSCAAEVGIKGSWMEMPFAAIELALGEQSAPGMPNEGFFRKESGESLLTVVIITDEDDCSVEEDGVIFLGTQDWIACDGTKGKGMYQAADVKAFLDELTGGPDRYVVVGIAGPGPQACQSEYGQAKYGKRIKELTDTCQNTVFGDICAGNLSASLAVALEEITATCDSLPPII